MVTTAGRPIVAALLLLLSETRLLALPRDKRFAALLADSRRFQNEVSERLAEQVLHALYELPRGLQAADDASKRELLREALAERPDDVYHALLSRECRASQGEAGTARGASCSASTTFAARVASFEDVTRYPRNDRTHCLGIASPRCRRAGNRLPGGSPWTGGATGWAACQRWMRRWMRCEAGS